MKSDKKHTRTASRALDWLRSGGRPGLVASNLFEAADQDVSEDMVDAGSMKRKGTNTCERSAPLQDEDDEVASPQSLDSRRVARGRRKKQVLTVLEENPLDVSSAERGRGQQAARLEKDPRVDVEVEEQRRRLMALQELRESLFAGSSANELTGVVKALQSQPQSSEFEEEKRLMSVDHKRRIAELRKVTGRVAWRDPKAASGGRDRSHVATGSVSGGWENIGSSGIASTGELSLQLSDLVSSWSSSSELVDEVYGEKRRQLASSSSIEEERLARKARDELEGKVVRQAEAKSFMGRVTKVANAAACSQYDERLRAVELSWKRRLQGLVEEVERLRRQNEDLQEDLQELVPLREDNARLAEECRQLWRLVAEKSQAVVEKEKDLQDAQASYSWLKEQVTKVKDAYLEMREQHRVSKCSERAAGQPAFPKEGREEVRLGSGQNGRPDKKTREEYSLDSTHAKHERLEKERQEMKQEIQLLRSELQKIKTTTT